MAKTFATLAHSPLQSPLHMERHFSVAEIAALWNLSADKVREIFEHEAGVVKIGNAHPYRKRRYITLRVPHSVVERVHVRLSARCSGD